MQPGLTMIVGPPGTGKTDVAVQIISNIYHNYPNQRTLVVTHSNQALNQLFEKIIALDVDERHLLRMGMLHYVRFFSFLLRAWRGEPGNGERFFPVWPCKSCAKRTTSIVARS